MTEGSIPSRRHRHHGSFRIGSIPSQTTRCPRPVSLAEETSETASFAESRLGRTPYGGSPLRVDHHSHCDGDHSGHRCARARPSAARALEEGGGAVPRLLLPPCRDLWLRRLGYRGPALRGGVLRWLAH